MLYFKKRKCKEERKQMKQNRNLKLRIILKENESFLNFLISNKYSMYVENYRRLPQKRGGENTRVSEYALLANWQQKLTQKSSANILETYYDIDHQIL
jgi:hypothetical protein